MHPDNSSVFDFGWPDACAGDEVAKEISFDMLDEFGTILGTEDLPFKVIKKGKFTLIDAI